MDEKRGWSEVEKGQQDSSRSTIGWLTIAVVALVIAAGVAVIYGYNRQATVSELTSHEAAMNATINQMQGQIDTLTGKLGQVSAALTAATAPTGNGAQSGKSPTATTRRTAAENKRMKQIQSQLADQQKQLKETQDAVAQNRSDIEANLNSTRDELNGSIAKTHEELVTLEQKGERNYFEFDLMKSKQFQRTGPIMVSLRKADPKHLRYDLAMVVDDNQLNKTRVNLYEPIWINGTDAEQLQIVVNKVDKNHVHGYVSEPKYRRSAGITPVSARVSGTSNQPTATQPTGSNSNAPDNQQQVPQ